MKNNNFRKEALHQKVHRHLKHHVHRLRGKSESHKKIASLTIATAVTLFVFVLWYFLTLPQIMQSYEVQKSENKRLGNSPVDSIKGIFNGKSAEATDTNTVTGPDGNASPDNNPYSYTNSSTDNNTDSNTNTDPNASIGTDPSIDTSNTDNNNTQTQ